MPSKGGRLWKLKLVKEFNSSLSDQLEGKQKTFVLITKQFLTKLLPFYPYKEDDDAEVR